MFWRNPESVYCIMIDLQFMKSCMRTSHVMLHCACFSGNLIFFCKKWQSFMGQNECNADGADWHTLWLCVPWAPQWWWPLGVSVCPICIIVKKVKWDTPLDAKTKISSWQSPVKTMLMESCLCTQDCSEFFVNQSCFELQVPDSFNILIQCDSMMDTFWMESAWSDMHSSVFTTCDWLLYWNYATENDG